MKTSDKMITSNIDWDFIIETIKAEKCILFIGPEVFSHPLHGSIQDNLKAFLDVKNNEDILSYYDKDGFFLFKSSGAKTKTYYKIKKFYLDEFPWTTEIFEKISQIPFHAIISVSPDETILKTFKKLQVRYKFDFYWKNQKVENVATPTKKIPLIYNIFGSIRQEESLILTHDDLFDYFKSIFGARTMPDELKTVLTTAHNYIFLGLEFDKWYMQLLLRLLYLHHETYKFARYAANQELTDEICSLCINEFKIEFVSRKIEEFVNELYLNCRSAGILREKEENKKSELTIIGELVSNGELENALSTFQDYLNGKGDVAEEMTDDLVVITNRYHRLQKKITQGIIDNGEADLQFNKIVVDVLSILSKAKKFE